jgi:hypothetical protein
MPLSSAARRDSISYPSRIHRHNDAILAQQDHWSEQPPRFAVRESRASATRSDCRKSRVLSRRGGCRSVRSFDSIYTMRRFWLVILVATGLFLLLSGFIYDVMFAGIPYQDPTPEVSARYAHHARIASSICWLGFGIFLFGSLAGIVRLVVRRFRPPVVS